MEGRRIDAAAAPIGIITLEDVIEEILQVKVDRCRREMPFDSLNRLVFVAILYVSLYLYRGRFMMKKIMPMNSWLRNLLLLLLVLPSALFLLSVSMHNR